MSFFIIGVSLPLGDDPPINQLPVVVIPGNMNQHAVPREELVIPQQVGVAVRRPDEGIGGGVPHRDGEFSLPAAVLLQGSSWPGRYSFRRSVMAVQDSYCPLLRKAGLGIGHLKAVVVHACHFGAFHTSIRPHIFIVFTGRHIFPLAGNPPVQFVQDDVG